MFFRQLHGLLGPFRSSQGAKASNQSSGHHDVRTNALDAKYNALPPEPLPVAVSHHYPPSGVGPSVNATPMRYSTHSMAEYQPFFIPSSGSQSSMVAPAHATAMARSAAPQQIKQFSGDWNSQGTSHLLANRPASHPTQSFWNFFVPHDIRPSAQAP